MSDKIIIIGLDGGTFDIFRPLANEKVMPFMKYLLENGVKRELMSTIPPISGPAWITMMTGKNPGKHGVFDWQICNSNGEREYINTNFLDQKTLWEILSAYNKRCLVFNFPGTYPPQEINGIIVSGMLTPSENCNYTHPNEYKEKIKNKYPKYKIDISHGDYEKNKQGIKKFIYDLIQITQQKTDLFIEETNNDMFDLAGIVYVGTDRIQHWLWEYLKDFILGVKDEEKITKIILEYYRELDKSLQKIILPNEKKANIFIISDHGFGTNNGRYLINNLLAKLGFFKLHTSSSNKIGSLVKKDFFLNERIKTCIIKKINELGLQSLSKLIINSFGKRTNMYKSKNKGAYADSPWSIKINGLNPGSKDYEFYINEVIKSLTDLIDETNGEPLFEMVKRREELFSGDKVPYAPDIFYLYKDERYISELDMINSKSFFLSPKNISTGIHKKEGIFIAIGNNIKIDNYFRKIDLIDIAPTVLYSMGIPIPQDFDGKIRNDFFLSEISVHSDYNILDNKLLIKKEYKNNLNYDEEEDIEKRLKSLGYL